MFGYLSRWSVTPLTLDRWQEKVSPTGSSRVRAQLWSHQYTEKDRRRRGEHSLSSSYLSPTSLSLALMLSFHTVRTPSPSCSLSPFASVASPVKHLRSWYSIVLSSLVMSPPMKPKAGSSIKRGSWRHSSPFSSFTSSSTALLWSLGENVPGSKGMWAGIFSHTGALIVSLAASGVGLKLL